VAAEALSTALVLASPDEADTIAGRFKPDKYEQFE
jgi:hypothetical protein